jgi:glutathione synthase/RimK-type ligase-like ATP-grasp enzyme
MAARRVALVAQYDGVDVHTDGPPMLAAFERRGIDAAIVPWGADLDWASYDGVVVRTAWDYLDRLDEFFAWARWVEAVTRFANPTALLEWNSDKRYLRDLEGAGVPIVPTVWVEPGERVPRWRWEEVVVKPSVSAGSRRTARYDGDDRAGVEAHVARIGADGGTAMIQPYLADVDRVGEAGTYVFGGGVSHAITKSPALVRGAPPREDFSLSHAQTAVRAELTGELVAFATDVVRRLPAERGVPLYARVDGLRGGDGRLVLLELEVFEPFLFLETDPEAAHRFARAVDDWLR